MQNLKDIFRNYIRNAAILAAFGLALAILSAAFLAIQLITMGYLEYAGMAAAVSATVIGLYTAILLIRQRRENMVQKQLEILMRDYDSPDNVARLRHYISDLEGELVNLRKPKQNARKSPTPHPENKPGYERV